MIDDSEAICSNLANNDIQTICFNSKGKSKIDNNKILYSSDWNDVYIKIKNINQQKELETLEK